MKLKLELNEDEIVEALTMYAKSLGFISDNTALLLYDADLDTITAQITEQEGQE